MLARLEGWGPDTDRQYWIAVGGGPGSGVIIKNMLRELPISHGHSTHAVQTTGKSTLTENLCRIINDRAGGEEDKAVVLPMDGYHYSRSELQKMGEDPDSARTYDELLMRRGSPWTFDAERFCEDMSRARAEGSASLPVYSRQKSDPVPHGVELKRSHRIVFVEGNYVLFYSDPRWAPLAPLFDEKWFIVCESREDQRNRLIKRHLETWNETKTKQFGSGKEGAGKKADSNDFKNAILIDDGSRKFADQIIISK